MSCQQVPTTPAFNPYPRSVQVGEFEVATALVSLLGLQDMTYLAKQAGAAARGEIANAPTWSMATRPTSRAGFLR